MSGDGRCDSPGYSAKYGTYTFLDSKTNLIADFEVVQSTETTSSVAMEKLGFCRTLDRCKQSLQVGVIVTDRSLSIKATMRDQYPDVCHQFDVWHFAKNVGSKLRSACRTKSQAPLLDWIPAIIGHLWWCCQTCGGNAQMLRERWMSLLYHVCNMHAWTEGEVFNKCAHAELSDDDDRAIKWLKAGRGKDKCKLRLFSSLKAICSLK